MEFNKCKRCGAFFVTNNNVCPNCEIKDNVEHTKLKNFLDENSFSGTVENLSISTGISEKNINRFLSEPDFKSYIGDIKIDL